MRDFLFRDLHLFKDPFNSTTIPGKGGRAPSHGGFRSRSGTINQTPPSPPPRLSISNLNNQRPRKARTKARTGPGGSARTGMRWGGAAKPTAAPAPVREALPQNRGAPPPAPAHPRARSSRDNQGSAAAAAAPPPPAAPPPAHRDPCGGGRTAFRA